MRLFPVVAAGSMRLVDRPLQVGSHHIPSGIVVAFPQYAIQRSARYFARPDEFLPERWLAKDSQRGAAEAGMLP